MPCIIDPNNKSSRQKGNIWGGFCGKTLWMENQPFKNLKEALKSGKPICRKCKRLAEDSENGISPPAPKTEKTVIVKVSELESIKSDILVMKKKSDSLEASESRLRAALMDLYVNGHCTTDESLKIVKEALELD